MKNKNIIIVTGASSGMGKEFVKQIDERFPNVDEIWLIARRKEVLRELAMSCNHVCRILAYDLCEKSAQDAIRALLAFEQPQIKLLVNSAGYGILGPFYKDEKRWMKEQTGMVSLNCEALTAMTYLCIPYMKNGGRIIQLASSAAFLPQPKFAVYAATKSYVMSFSRALNVELKKQKRGIKVMAVCPGWVRTDFFERAVVDDTITYYNKYFTPQEVVERALKDMKRGRDVSVCGASIRAQVTLTKLLPHGIVMEIWCKQQKK